MKDTIKTIGSIKGRTKIELFNKDGELDYIREENNIFSDAWLKYANSKIWGTSVSSVSHPKGYMCIYNSDKTPEELISVQKNKEIENIGYSDLYSDNANPSGIVGARNSKLGRAFNPNMVTKKNLSTFVCEFPAGVATGTFNTISLCNNASDLYVGSYVKYTMELFQGNDSFQSYFKSSGTTFSAVKRGNLLYCSHNYSAGVEEGLCIFDEYYNFKRKVTPPVTGTYYYILDLEPDKTDTLYVQLGNKDLYKWNLTNDEFEKVNTWSSTARCAFKLLKDGEDIVAVMVSGNYYRYDSETYSLGEQLNTGTNNTLTGVRSFKRKDGDYIFIVGGYRRMYVFTSTEDFLTLNTDICGTSDTEYNYHLAIVDWFFDEETGFVRVIAKHATSVSYITVFDFYPNRYTVNRLAETVVKAEDHFLRLTYTLETDM